MSDATCTIKGCALTEHDPRALDLHEGQRIMAETWEVAPSLQEGTPWKLDVYAPASREMTTAEARAFATEIIRQADLVDHLNMEAE